MKKFITLFWLVMLSISLFAQYKKASFFDKSGRTYEMGAESFFLGNGQGTPLGYYINIGRDNAGKHFTASYEIMYLPSYQYSYATTDNNSSQNINVTGKTKGILIYGLNYGYFLLKNESDEKIKPYVFTTIDLILTGGIKNESTNPDGSSPKMQTDWPAFQIGLGGGAGCVFQFTDKWGLRLNAGYRYMVQLHNFQDQASSFYKLFGSHLNISAGIRMRITQD